MFPQIYFNVNVIIIFISILYIYHLIIHQILWSILAFIKQAFRNIFRIIADNSVGPIYNEKKSPVLFL